MYRFLPNLKQCKSHFATHTFHAFFPKITITIRGSYFSYSEGAWCHGWIFGLGFLLVAAREVIGATVGCFSVFLCVVLVAARNVFRWQVCWNEEH